MKTTLIYFTGTGNSLSVARLLALRLSPATIYSVAELLDRSFFAVDSDACGFVFPVYCQNAPEIVQRLVQVIKIPRQTYVFAVATHNGSPGYSHFTLDALLKKQGSRLSAGFAVLMPGNSITPVDMTNSSQERQRRLDAADACVEEMSHAIIRRQERPFVGDDSLRKRFKGFRNMFRHKVVYRVQEKFWATDACNSCGICEKICPEKNIHVAAGRPEWGTRCQMCLACIHWCPQQAIQNGIGTLSRKRYHHPDITVSDMCVKRAHNAHAL